MGSHGPHIHQPNACLLCLQKGFLTRLLSKSQFFRSRLLFDPRFLFIVGAEMVIDTGAQSSSRLGSLRQTRHHYIQ